MKCVTKKRAISFLIIIFLIAGMCFDIPNLESLAHTEVVVFDKTGTLTKAKPTVAKVVSFNGDSPDELLRIGENESYIVQEIIQSIRLNARQNYRTRFLTGYIRDLTYNFAYMTYVSLTILLSGIIFFSITVIMYIHAKDGEKQNNTL